LAHCLALLLINFSNAQESVTGNLVNFTGTPTATTSNWYNAGQVGGSLSCWSPQDGWYGAYCGPRPYVNANGYGMINFSYGYTDLHQVVNIANALPNSGTGLQVTGFNFAFRAKNGNGWDGARQDYLDAYVLFTDPSGKVLEHYDYGAWTNRRYDWTNFYFSETFSAARPTKDLGTAQYGFIGYDTNGWAGPYGPEVTNVQFSLKYSVDMCAMDVLSSPTCPGYLEAISKFTVPTAAAPEPVVQAATQPTETVSTSSPTAVVTTQPVANTTAPTSVTPATTTAATTSSQSKPGASLQQILGIVRAEQDRVSSVEKQTVSQAVSAALTTSSKAKEEAETVALQAVQQLTSQTTFQGGNSVQTNSKSVVNVLANSGPQAGSAITNSFKPTEIAASIQQPQPIQILQNIAPAASIIQQEQPRLPEQIFFSNTPASIAPVPKIEVPEPTKLVAAIRPGEFTPFSLTDTTEIKQPEVNQNTGPSVNKSVSNNELATGKGIEQLATIPKSFNLYTQALLQDAQFYSDKPVYRNQRVVDNQKVLRQLSSDRLHQQLVELQYQK